MIVRRVFSFLKNFLLFLIDRLYNEWIFINGKGRTNKGVSKRGDLYVKQLIDNMIHDDARKCEPYIVNGISAMSYGSTGVVLEKAYLSGLNTLHRVKKCFLTVAGNRKFLNATFRAGPLIYQREILFQFGNFERKTYLLVTLENIKVSVDLSFEKETGRNGFLQNLTVKKLKGFNLNINGLSYFDWIINLVISFLTFVFGRMVRNLLENELEQYILHRLSKYQFPVDLPHRNETKLNTPPEDIQNNEASLYKTYHIKQNYKRPKSSRVPPLAKKTRLEVRKGCNSIESRSNQETTKSSKRCLLTNNCMTEVNSFCLLEPNLDIIKGYLPMNSSFEFLKDKSEENCYHFSAIPKDTQNLSCSLNEVKGNLVPISIKRKLPFQEISSINRSNNTCQLFDYRNSVEMNDGINETESNSRENKAHATSFHTKTFKLRNPQKASFLASERLPKLDKESEMESSSQRLQDFCENLVDMAFEGFSERLNDISLKLRELSNEKFADENTLNEEVEPPYGFANYDLSLIERESTQIDFNILEHDDEASMVRSEIFLNTDLNPSLMFCDEVTEEQKVLKEDSMESFSHYQDNEADSSASIHDSELSNAEMDLKDFRNMNKDCAHEDDLKVLEPGIQTQIEDTENTSYTEILLGNQSVEMPKSPFVYNPEGGLEKCRPNFKIEVISDLMEPPLVKDEMELETETEMTSASLQFSEKHEDEVNEKILFNYLEDETKDILNRASDRSIFEGLRKIGTKLYNIKKEDRKSIRKLERMFTDDFSKGESSSEDELKLNEDNSQTCFGETTELKEMDDLQKEIITKTRKLKSNFKLGSDSEDDENADDYPVSCFEELTNFKELEDLQKEIITRTRKLKFNFKLRSDSADDENANSFPVSCNKNIETKEQKYPEREDMKISCHPRGDCLSFYATESSSESDNEPISNNLIYLEHGMVKLVEKCTPN